MAYGRRDPSFFEAFTISPLPYPVLFILLVVLLLLGLSWSFTYEEMVESAEEQINWILLATPVVLLLLIRYLSSVESSLDLGFFGYDSRRRRSSSNYAYEQPSPWVVGFVLVLLLVLVSFQSTFQDMWKA